MADDYSEPSQDVACPNCGKPVPIGKMNVCYIGRYDCPHCGVTVLIEGDKITAEPS